MERRPGLNEIKVMFANVQSIVNKLDEIRALMQIQSPDIFAVTESWTNDDIGNDVLRIQGYEIIDRLDRNDTDRGRGGGIIVYAKNNVDIMAEDGKTSFNQCSTVKINSKGEDVRLHVIYRSPNSAKTNDEDLCKWMREMRGQNVLIGDFNFPDIDWSLGTAGSRGREFYDTTMEMFMEQHITEATHRSGNILDLVLCDQEIMVTGVTMEGRVGKSDHDIVVFNLCVTKPKDPGHRLLPNYRKAEFEKMREALRKTDWKEAMNGKSVNENWIAWKERIKNLMSEYIPMKRRRNFDEPQWMDSEVKKSIRKKKEAWKKMKQSNRATDKEEYKKCVKEVKKKIRNKKNALERRVMMGRKSNPKSFYAYINSAKKTRNKIGPLKNEDGVAVTDPRELAQILNKQYVSVFTRSQDDVEESDLHMEVHLEDISITHERIVEAIDKINEQSASGPDGIPARVIKELKQEIKTPLALLFRQSMDEGVIPDEWRDAEVTPIFKKGSKAEPANYRPVSLTVIVGKVMERLVKNTLMDYVEKNGHLSDAQHGFRAGRSTQTNLIEFLDVTTKWMDEGKAFDIVYLDFSKAFDKVCHRRLIKKLKNIGVGGKILAWLKNWLTGRRQRVRVDDKFSDWVEVLSSVVQGSVLGGTLFDIFIDDIRRVVLDALIQMFADDTKVATTIETEEDCKKMQKIIDNLVEWADKWKMSFNVDKCKIVHVGHNNPKKEYYMKGKKLKVENDEKDLGVFVEASMKPGKQCTTAAKSANFALGQIQRAFHYRKKEYLVPLYKTFVRPKLEYASSAWSPWLEKDKTPLEKVQGRLVRMISDVKGSNYEEKLKDAGLTTLEKRRQRGDAIQAFKTIKGFSRVQMDKWFTFEDENARSLRSNTMMTDEGERRRQYVMKCESARLETRKNSYRIRVAKEWNKLPEWVKDKDSVNAFKNAYDKWFENQSRTRDEDEPEVR